MQRGFQNQKLGCGPACVLWRAASQQQQSQVWEYDSAGGVTIIVANKYIIQIQLDDPYLWTGSTLITTKIRFKNYVSR